ncbi:MAG: hypothetical protein ACRC92_26095 [Peptostreptococcaceae bacterium]
MAYGVNLINKEVCSIDIGIGYALMKTYEFLQHMDKDVRAILESGDCWKGITASTDVLITKRYDVKDGMLFDIKFYVDGNPIHNLNKTMNNLQDEFFKYVYALVYRRHRARPIKYIVEGVPEKMGKHGDFNLKQMYVKAIFEDREEYVTYDVVSNNHLHLVDRGKHPYCSSEHDGYEAPNPDIIDVYTSTWGRKECVTFLVLKVSTGDYIKVEIPYSEGYFHGNGGKGPSDAVCE